jgi:F0F1-type ATP synthase epsilon subunit
MTLQQHIDELRAELSWNDDAKEIAQIEAELAAALAQLQQQEPDG